ncbi:MAG: extracellular solute-binding protein [Halobacteriaceae archaeon]
MRDDRDDGRHASRRRVLSTAATGTAAALAGCTFPGGDGGGVSVPPLARFRGSGSLVSGRPAPGGTEISELPDLEGELNVYVGGGEGGLYLQFIDLLEEIYPDFEVAHKTADSASLAQTLVEEVEAGAPQADVFWSVDAGALGYVTDADAYRPLPSEVVEPVPGNFVGSDRAWVGVAGRARSVPYNSDRLSASDVPGTVAEFPAAGPLQDAMAWAPTYGAFKSFVTAMRLLRGPEETRGWLREMQSGAVTDSYPNEYLVSQAVADGEVAAGFANHYYALRVKNVRPDAPLELAFTNGDAGALVNVAGALTVKGTRRADLAATFVRHLLSAEAQEYFATVAFAYPMIRGVAPVGDLPPVEELNPPELDLSELSNLEPTIELMREAGVLG